VFTPWSCWGWRGQWEVSGAAPSAQPVSSWVSKLEYGDLSLSGKGASSSAESSS